MNVPAIIGRLTAIRAASDSEREAARALVVMQVGVDALLRDLRNAHQVQICRHWLRDRLWQRPGRNDPAEKLAMAIGKKIRGETP